MNPPLSEINVIGLSGSLRQGSFTKMAVATALEGAAELGAQTTLLDLRELDLPLCNGDLSGRSYPEQVHQLRAQVKAAHGVILGTPEYHGSFSGVLKNALDLMGFEQFENTVVGLVGVAGGRMGAMEALTGLRTIGRSLHAWVVPQQAALPVARNLFDREGTLTDERLAKRVRSVGAEVARFSALLQLNADNEFLCKWRAAFDNPGGGEPASASS